MIVILQIRVPESVDEDSQKLIEQFAEKNTEDLREGLSF